MEEAWTEFTVEAVLNAFPTDLTTIHASWVDANPVKVNRLSEVVAEVRRTFRNAVEANPANRMDENPDTVPSTGFRHALNMVIFNMGMEIGVDLSPLVYGLITRAEIWLRMVQNGQIPIDSTEGEGTPSYAVGLRAET
jgi:hypothetical protein